MSVVSQQAIKRVLLHLAATIDDPDTLVRPSGEIESYIQAMQATQRTIQTEIQRQTAALTKRQNAMQLFNQLPTELIIEILLTSLNDKFGTRRLRELSNVCVRWWNIIKSCPTFWACVDVKDVQAVFKLSKSKNVSLEIRCMSSSGDPTASEFFATAGPMSYRWRSLEFTGHRCDVLASYLQTPIPLLETLFLHNRSNAFREPLAIGGGRRLSAVTLFSVLPSWSNSVVDSLKKLTLGGFSGPLAPSWTFDTLLPDLSTCSRLEELLVTDIFYSSLTTVTFPEAAFLPSLRKLVVCDCSANYTLHVLRSIQADALIDLTVHHRADDGGGETIWRELTEVQSGRPSYLQTVLETRAGEGSTACVAVDHHTMDMVCYPSPGVASNREPHFLRLTLDLGPMSGTLWRAVLAEHGSSALPLLPPVHVAIRDRSDDLNVSFLSHLRTLQSFHIISLDPRVSARMLHFLSQPRQYDQNWSCPQLAVLKISYPERDEDLITDATTSLVSKRASADATGVGVLTEIVVQNDRGMTFDADQGTFVLTF